MKIVAIIARMLYTEREEFQMDRTNGLEQTASTSLSVNVFTAPGKSDGRRTAKALRRSARL